MEQSSFFNAEKTANGTYDRTYNAEDWAAYFATFVGNGVSCTPNTNLEVESSSGMNVIVNSGVAFINGYRYENTTPLTVQINQDNSTYDRITSIILELNLNNRNIICTTLDGTAEPNPQPPTLIRTDSIYQLQLATVYVSAGTTNCGAITDTRENKQACGFLELLAPTLPPTLIKNCDFQNVSLHDALNNYGTINGGTISNVTLDNVNITGDVNNYTTISGGTYNNPTLTGNITTNSNVNVNNYLDISETDGAINFLDNNNNMIIQLTVSGDTFLFANEQTGKAMFMVTPVSQGIDTLNINANINAQQPITILPSGGINFNSNNANILAFTYDQIHNRFGLFEENTWRELINIPYDMNEIDFNVPIKINAGLYNNNNPVASASTLNVSNVHVQDNVTGTINLEYWALNAGLLSANTNNLTCGIIKASITLDSNCTWNNINPIYLNVEGFPNANAMTVTYQKNFVVGCGQNVIVLNGNNAYLNANQTYTEYALIYG